MENKEQIWSNLEAILLVAGDPVMTENLAKFFKLKVSELEKELDDLEKNYQQRQSGLALVRKNGWVQLVSATQCSERVANFLEKELTEKISESASEVLAIVAYRGPISRAEIDYIRGVNSGFLLRNLALRGLVEKKDNPLDSRSYIYEVSLDFLKSLGIARLEELPEYAILKKKSEEVFAEKFNQDNKLRNKIEE